jgi:hypothetical protein
MNRREQRLIGTDPPIVTLSDLPTTVGAIGWSRRPDLLPLSPLRFPLLRLDQSSTMRVPS